MRSFGRIGRKSTGKQQLGRLKSRGYVGRLAAVFGLLMLFSGCQLVQAGTWESIGPERGGTILSLATDPFNSHLIYVGSSNGLIYAASANSGENLVPGIGIPASALVTAILADPEHKGTIYAGTSAGLYVSTDQSSIWSRRGTGFPAGDTMDALAYAEGQHILFAGSVYHGVYTSHNQGDTWQESSRGLPAASNVNALLFEPTTQTLYVAVDGVGVFASTNLGASWGERSKGLPQEVYALTELAANGINTKGVTLYAGTSQGVYASTDNGASWKIAGDSPRQAIYSLCTYPPISGWIYAGTDADVIRSPDGGGTWSTVAAGLTDRVLAVVSVPATPSSSGPAYVVFAASANLWRYPPVQGGGTSGAAGLLIDGTVLLVMFGLVFYFLYRARRRLNTHVRPPAAAAAAARPAEPNTPGEPLRSVNGRSSPGSRASNLVKSQGSSRTTRDASNGSNGRRRSTK